MQPSPAGLVVCIGVFLVGYFLRAPVVICLIASLAFGSTAAVTLGGSSPLIYTMFAALIICTVAARRHIWRDIGRLFGRIPDIWVICFFMVYSVVGCILLPRLFAGQTSAFTKTSLGVIVETSLAPVAGNITQTGYFVLNGLAAIALCIVLLHRPRWDQVGRGFMLWCFLTAAMGGLDLLGKLAGAGDVLAPIRTANYAMLTESAQGNFYRIAGAFSEASGFATMATACLAYTYTYWRRTGDTLAMSIWITLLILLTLSTSSTAYVGLAGLGAVLFAIVGRSLVFSARIDARELGLVVLLLLALVLTIAIALRNENFFDPFLDLLDTMIFDKAASSSGRERSYWNVKSLQAFYDTYGLGIGMGSSRASSWPVAVLSQLGLIGSVLMLKLLMMLFSNLDRIRTSIDPRTEAVVASVRASALASLIAASLVSGTPDPGLLFFIAFAVVAAAKASALDTQRRHVGLRLSTQ